MIIRGLPVPPPFKNESVAAHRARSRRWQLYLVSEPRPDLWYASEDEVRLYEEWRDSTEEKKRER